MEGVLRDRVGYTGGTTPDPTYSNIGDHSESIEIEFDPTVISYEQLLEVFWESHSPTAPATCDQYKSAIFYHDDAQRALAQTTKAEKEALWETVVHTDILAVETFYQAEDYHQKWYLRNVGLIMTDFNAIYPDAQDFINSTAAARVNGVVARHYTAERLAEDIDSFGLSETSNERLWTYVQ